MAREPHTGGFKNSTGNRGIFVDSLVREKIINKLESQDSLSISRQFGALIRNEQRTARSLGSIKTSTMCEIEADDSREQRTAAIGFVVKQKVC